MAVCESPNHMTQLCLGPLSFKPTQMHQQTHLNTKATHKNTHKPSPTHRITPLTNILMSLTVLSFCQTIMFYHGIYVPDSQHCSLQD